MGGNCSKGSCPGENCSRAIVYVLGNNCPGSYPGWNYSGVIAWGFNVRGVIVQGEFHGEELSRAVIHGEIVTEPLPIFR